MGAWLHSVLALNATVVRAQTDIPGEEDPKSL